MTSWQTVPARIVPGHRVASGGNGDPRFPGGTLHMQTPHFRELGLDLGAWHPGTMNVSIAPCAYQVLKAPLTFRQVKWHPVEPAEDFSFFDVRVTPPQGGPVRGLIYFPHPDTKPEHFQKPDVLELLLPFIPGLAYGQDLLLEIPDDQIRIARNPDALPPFPSQPQ